MIDLEYEHISEKFAKDLKDVWGDKQVIKYTNIKNPCSINEVNKRIERFKEHDIFVVKNNGQAIGVIGCPCINKEKAMYGIFYQFRKSMWGKGIASQSVLWLLDYMKEKYKNITLYADVVSENIASDKILNKFGFKYISSDENGFVRDGNIMTVKNYIKLY